MRLKRFLFISFFLLLSIRLTGQNATVELGLITDNDLYTSSKNDQYYTNGLQLFYRYLSKKENPALIKKINEFRIGQFMYMPRKIYVDEEEKVDRPFAGYLFGEYGNSLFYTNQSVLKKYVQIGFIGSNSFADRVQSGTHKLFHYTSFEEWDYQIKNDLGIQLYGMYSKPILHSIQNNTFDFNWQSEAKIGTVFNSLSTTVVARIGFKKLLPISDSNFYGASISRGKSLNETEFYFYMAPSFNIQFYDATIQGGLFNNDSPVTFDIKPFRFNGEAGLRYRKNNWNLSYAFVYRGKEVKFHRNIGYFYGSIMLSYLF